MRFFSILVILFLFFSPIYATNSSSSSELANLLNAIHTMRANFVQTIYDNKGKAVQKSYGEMAIERPGKFRWQVKKPIPQLIIANQSRLWIYDPDLEQVTIRKLSKVSNETPALLLSQVNELLDKDYNVKTLAANNADQKRFQLLPRNKDNMFLNIEMVFLKNQIINMSLTDHLGHSTSIDFKNAILNTSLPANLFNFKPPAHTDIIQQ